MMHRFKDAYRRQMFNPNWLGIFVNPFYLARAGLCKTMIELAPNLTGRLLDVGCGSKPYRLFFTVDVYIGLDVDNKASREQKSADHLYDGKSFPFADGSFDSILCSQVLEHVFNPDEFVGEIARVMKPGGRLLITVPFIWDEHEQPYDYARYSSFGLRAILEKNGFEVVQHRKLEADASFLFQLTNAYLFKVTLGLPKTIKLFLTITVMAFFNACGLFVKHLLPANPDFFLDQVVLAVKVS